MRNIKVGDLVKYVYCRDCESSTDCCCHEDIDGLILGKIFKVSDICDTIHSHINKKIEVEELPDVWFYDEELKLIQREINPNFKRYTKKEKTIIK